MPHWSVAIASLTFPIAVLWLGCKRESGSATRHEALPGAIAFRIVADHPTDGTSVPSLRFVGHGDSAAVSLGRDTIILRHVAMVLQEILLAPAKAGDCDANPEEDEVECPALQQGTALLVLPLAAAVPSAPALRVPADTYSLVQLRIHVPDSRQDSAFIAAHPDFADWSILVQGAYSRAGRRRPFTYATSFNEREALELAPPLLLGAGDTAGLKLHIDLATWFLAADKSRLIDPATAVPGGPNENLVRDNIRLSLAAFGRADRAGKH